MRAAQKTLEAEATYARLPDQTWGIRVPGPTPSIGKVLIATRRDGTTERVKVTRIVESGTDRRTKKPVSLCEFCPCHCD
jgi:hypothetical protein